MPQARTARLVVFSLTCLVTVSSAAVFDLAAHVVDAGEDEGVAVVVVMTSDFGHTPVREGAGVLRRAAGIAEAAELRPFPINVDGGDLALG